MFLARSSWRPIVKTLNLNVWALPLIFLHEYTLFVIDMHQNRSILLFSTPSDHFQKCVVGGLKLWHLLRCRLMDKICKVVFDLLPYYQIDFSSVLQINRGHDNISTKLLWGKQQIYRAEIPYQTFLQFFSSIYVAKISWNFQYNWIFLPLRFNDIKVMHKKTSWRRFWEWHIWKLFANATKCTYVTNIELT